MRYFVTIVGLAAAALAVAALWPVLGEDDDPPRAGATTTMTTPAPTATPTPIPEAGEPPRGHSREVDMKRFKGSNGTRARFKLSGTPDRVQVLVKVVCSGRTAVCDVGRSSNRRRIQRRLGTNVRGTEGLHRDAVSVRGIYKRPYLLVEKYYLKRGREARRVILRARMDKRVKEVLKRWARASAAAD